MSLISLSDGYCITYDFNFGSNLMILYNLDIVLHSYKERKKIWKHTIYLLNTDIYGHLFDGYIFNVKGL